MNRRERHIMLVLGRAQVRGLRSCAERRHLMGRIRGYDPAVRRWKCHRCGMEMIAQEPPSPDYGTLHGVALYYDCRNGDAR